MIKKDWVEIFKAAHAAGMEAGEGHTPEPMDVVQYADPLTDGGAVVRRWHVPDGVCGFAWINVKAKGTGAKFINAMKKAGFAGEWGDWRKDSYYGGYTFWVKYFGQSYERKMAYAEAFAAKLAEHGIPAHASGRLD